MQERKLIIRRETGIHLRPAQEIVNVSNQFSCDIYLQNGPRRVNAKSIMGIIGLAAAQGCELAIITDGVDEVDAMNTLFEMIENGFPGLKEEA